MFRRTATALLAVLLAAGCGRHETTAPTAPAPAVPELRVVHLDVRVTNSEGAVTLARIQWEDEHGVLREVRNPPNPWRRDVVRAVGSRIHVRAEMEYESASWLAIQAYRDGWYRAAEAEKLDGPNRVTVELDERVE